MKCNTLPCEIRLQQQMHSKSEPDELAISKICGQEGTDALPAGKQCSNSPQCQMLLSTACRNSIANQKDGCTNPLQNRCQGLSGGQDSSWIWPYSMVTRK